MLLLYLTLANTPQKKEMIKAIYTEHCHAMYGAALAILGHEDLAEDAVHDAMVQLIEGLNLAPTKDPAKVRGFVVLLARHRALDILRREMRRNGKLTDPMQQIAVQDRYEGLEHADLLAAMESLPAIYREILQLHVQYDLTPKELAKLLSITEHNAYKRLRRAQEMMRIEWEKQNADE